MGRGSSGAVGGGGSGGGGNQPQDFPEAFAPGKDFQAVGGVDHNARTVSRTTQREWDQFSAPYQTGVTSADDADIMRDFSMTPNADGAYVQGYVRTQNSFAINKILYNPANDGKTPDQMFKRQSDVDTVKTMDKLINNHSTQADASYTRFCSPGAVQATFGLSDSQMKTISGARSMNSKQLAQLNRSLRGSESYSAAFTSTSANRSLNAFSNPNAKQSKGFVFERKISVKAGTKAYAPRKNAQESEVIFGRGMQTKLTGVSVASDGHIVLHETFVKYR